MRSCATVFVSRDKKDLVRKAITFLHTCSPCSQVFVRFDDAGPHAVVIAQHNSVPEKPGFTYLPAKLFVRRFRKKQTH